MVDYEKLWVDAGNFIMAIRDANNWEEHLNGPTPESVLNEVLSYMNNRETFAICRYSDNG